MAAARATPLLLLPLLLLINLLIFPVWIVHSVITICIIICCSTSIPLGLYTHACVLIPGVSFTIAADSDSIAVTITAWFTTLWPAATAASCCMVWPLLLLLLLLACRNECMSTPCATCTQRVVLLGTCCLLLKLLLRQLRMQARWQLLLWLLQLCMCLQQ
jgi:hypothetical protein